ncbi:MAG: SUMF1/EgtB/PvdO family nonheme iron enzyme, partial [Desulfobacteraceae bacterium]|nr:SUMF1/EgtB/PvdO family nonheme iron enzyme [Desulfobacteraceae bacterium]
GCFHKGASPYGILDMSGNVWEWCSDWFDMNYYADSPLTDPAGPQKGSRRVHRGGSWVDDAEDCRSAYRNDNSPGYRRNLLGFRLSRGLHL